MANIGKIVAALFSGSQEATLALANLNFDFSLVKVEAPVAFQGVGTALTNQRRDVAESGSTHITARKLGALFEQVIPQTPRLLEAYGSRASEIAKSALQSQDGPSGRGIFSDYLGPDATSIWAAATSGRTAIAVHLLACLLARMWKPAEAISIWEEVVKARKRELQGGSGEETFHASALLASQVSLTREQLAEWDNSARSWLRYADKAREVEQTKVKFVIDDLRLPVTSKGSLYESVIDAWTIALKGMEDLLKGTSQGVSNAGVMLALSSWHLYPDISVQGRAPIMQNDPLFPRGAVVSLNLEGSPSKATTGIYWSLSLSHLRYYGAPIQTERNYATESSRISFDQLLQAVLGSLSCAWGPEGSTPSKLAQILQIISTNTPKSSLPWIKMLADAGQAFLESSDSRRKLNMKLFRLGREKGESMLAERATHPLPVFGLAEFSAFLGALKNPEYRLKILRKYSARFFPTTKPFEVLLRYHIPKSYWKPRHKDIGSSEKEFDLLQDMISKQTANFLRESETAEASPLKEDESTLNDNDSSDSEEKSDMDSTLKSQFRAHFDTNDQLEGLNQAVKLGLQRTMGENAKERAELASHIGSNVLDDERGGNGRLYHGVFPVVHAITKKVLRGMKPKSKSEVTIAHPKETTQTEVPVDAALSGEHSAGDCDNKSSEEQSTSVDVNEGISSEQASADAPMSMSPFPTIAVDALSDNAGTAENIYNSAAEHGTIEYTTALPINLKAESDEPRYVSWTDRNHDLDSFEDITPFTDIRAKGDTWRAFDSAQEWEIDADLFGAATSEKGEKAQSETSDKQDDISSKLKYKLFMGNEKAGAIFVKADVLDKHEEDWKAPRWARLPRIKRSIDVSDIEDALKDDELDLTPWLTTLNKDFKMSRYFQSLEALSFASQLYSQLNEATISPEIVETPIVDRSWAKMVTYGSTMSRDQAFACIANFETGGIDLSPSRFANVMAMSTPDSIYVSARLLSDPANIQSQHAIRRLSGNVGKPGLILLVPPADPMTVKPKAGNWRFIDREEYTGQREDYFGGTSLHLSFTDWTISIDIGESGRGRRDVEAHLVESLVSVFDRGRWIADLDVLSALNKGSNQVDHQYYYKPGCKHKDGREVDPTTLENGIVTTKTWDEFLEPPSCPSVVMAYENWEAKLALAALGVARGDRVFVNSDKVCDICLEELIDIGGQQLANKALFLI